MRRRAIFDNRTTIALELPNRDCAALLLEADSRGLTPSQLVARLLREWLTAEWIAGRPTAKLPDLPPELLHAPG